MKQIFKRLWMFIIIISFFTMNEVKAEHKHELRNPPIYEVPGLVKRPVPVYCGPTEFMLKTATEEFNQEPLVVGKVIVPRTGELIAMVTVFVSKDRQFDMSVLMTMFNKNETCLLAYSKELKFFKPKEDNDVKPGSYNGV